MNESTAITQKTRRKKSGLTPIPKDLDIWRLASHFETAKIERCRIHLNRDEMTKCFEIQAAQQTKFIEVLHRPPPRQELGDE